MSDPELEEIRRRKLERLKEEAERTGHAPAEPIDLRPDELDEALGRHDLVLLDLWAPWCGPCRQMGPVLESLARDHQGELVVGKVDVDQHPQVGQRFGARSIPTLILFEDGDPVDRIVGAQGRPQLEQRLGAYLD